MAYTHDTVPPWMDIGVTPAATNDFINDYLDDDDGKRLKAGMTWCTFLAYVERCSLQVRRLRFSFFGDEIGRGRFFEVYRYQIQAGARLAFTTQQHKILDAGTIVALKRVIPRSQSDNRISLEDRRQLQAIATEIRALTKASLREHENIIEMYALAWEGRGEETALWPTIIMEYCPCTLAELQSERESPLSPLLKFQIVQGVSFGVGALHIEDIIHGDIKSENVLIKILDGGMIIPKLADFGSSVVQLNTNLVEIGGTDPWRAPECVTLKGKIPLDLAAGTDFYSLGLLIWRIFRDGQDPFTSLSDIDYLHRNDTKIHGDHFSHWQPRSAIIFEVDRKERERAHIEHTIQALKESDAVIRMAIDDTKFLQPSDGHSSAGLKILFSAYLKADPEARFEAIKTLVEGLDLVSDIDATEDADEENVHPSAAQKWHINHFPTTVFSIHNQIRKEILDPELRMGESTRRRVFQELLLVARGWDNQRYPECKGCCNISPFDKPSPEAPLSMEVYIKYIVNEAGIHTCTRENTALSYNMPVKDVLGQRNEIYIVIFNLFVCYIDGYGVEADVEEGLSWLLKAARWGSATAQNELATCLLHFGKPMPPETPVVKWLMHSLVLWDLSSTRNTLLALKPKCFEVARQARWTMFDGTSVNISNWTFDAEKTITLEEFEIQRASANQGASGCVSAPGHDDGVDGIDGQCDSWDGNMIIHSLASSWRQPVDLCRQFCQKYPDLLDSPNSHGETPLLLACRSRRPLMISLLLSVGADASRSAGKGGETPLHWVVLADDDGVFSTIEHLLTRGGDVNFQNTEVRTYSWWPSRPASWSSSEYFYNGSALHWAVLAGKTRMVKFLIGKGAYVDIKSLSGKTPISIAVSMRRSDLVQVLLEGRKSNEIQPPDGILLRGLFYDSTDFTRIIQGFNECDERRTLEVLLRCSPQKGNHEEVEAYFNYAVYRGVCAMSCDLLSRLLDGLDHCYSICDSNSHALTGQPLNRDIWGNMDLIHFVVKRNDPSILDLVLQRGADIKERDTMDYTCLHTLAVSKGNEECLRILLKHGAQVDWRTNRGWLPFHFAIFAGNTDVAQALKNAMSSEQFRDAVGIITNTKSSKFPLTFLGHAITLRSLSFTSIKGISWLLDLPEFATAFDTVCPEGGYSPLHLAVDGLDFSSGVFKDYGKLPILRLLLTRFATPEKLNHRSANTYTALHLAVWLGKFEETRLLVDAGANINALSNHGTPLDVTFVSPPSLFNKLELGPTREMIRRFMEGRNAIAKYLRLQGAKCVAELQVAIQLGDWIPYAIESGEHVEYFQSSTFARMRWGRRRYGCSAIRPALRPERFMQGDLTARDLVIPEMAPSWHPAE